jgi:hypothetical protein
MRFYDHTYGRKDGDPEFVPKVTTSRPFNHKQNPDPVSQKENEKDVPKLYAGRGTVDGIPERIPHDLNLVKQLLLIVAAIAQKCRHALSNK